MNSEANILWQIQDFVADVCPKSIILITAINFNT